MTKRPWTSGELKVRHRSDGITSGFEISINKEQFPYGITAPADPFMLGKCVAVVASEADARLFAAASAMYEALDAAVGVINQLYQKLGTVPADELADLTATVIGITAPLRAANPDAFGEGE